MAPLIQLRSAAFGYGGKSVVSGVDLEIDAGRFFGIVGPNGAGKTTLFRGLLGLLPPSEGQCRSAPGTVFGYVPQRESLDARYPLSAVEVVEMGAYRRLDGARRVSRDDRDAARALIERVGLGTQHRAPFAQLSGGQRQRLLLARALLTRPDVLLLDEPTSGVDRAAQESILALLEELHGEGLTILLVSHQIPVVRDAVEEVLLVSGGRVQRGDPREMLAPENLDQLFGVGQRS